MDKRFFESVISKSNQKFEDSSNRLYRFIEDQTAEENPAKVTVENKESSKYVKLFNFLMLKI